MLRFALLIRLFSLAQQKMRTLKWFATSMPIRLQSKSRVEIIMFLSAKTVRSKATLKANAFQELLINFIHNTENSDGSSTIPAKYFISTLSASAKMEREVFYITLRSLSR